jgi:hypothetical protein
MLGGTLGLKLDRAKHAGQSYIRDRVEQAEAAAMSYVIAASLYAAAGVFLIAALLVGVTALFRWIELRYGLFQAFGAMGGLLIVITVLCALFAIYRIKRPAKRITPLASRLRVAIGTLPSGDDAVPGTAISAVRPPGAGKQSGSSLTALLIASSLLGWALVRRKTNHPL